MYQVIYQDGNNIEIALSGDLSKDEFIQVIHQLESLCSANTEISVLFDASDLKKYEFRIILDEFDFYKKYKNLLNRIAMVSDLKFESFLIKQFERFSDVEFKSFASEHIEAARKWIFPSKLPA
jgi:hypothetical protein